MNILFRTDHELRSALLIQAAPCTTARRKSRASLPLDSSEDLQTSNGKSRLYDSLSTDHVI